MRLENITLLGFKGIDASDNLSPLMLFSGPKGSGKSARLQAIQWAMTGCSKLGRKAESAAAYGSPTGMKVEVRLDDGFHVTRGLDLDSREGKISQLLSTDSSESLGIRESQARLEEHVGRFMPMWDLGEFLSLKSEGRRELILSLCGKAAAGRWSCKVLFAMIERLVLHNLLDPGTVDTVFEGIPDDATSLQYMEAVERLYAKLNDEERAAWKALSEKVQKCLSADVSESIATLTEKMKEEISKTNAGAESATQAARALADRKAEVNVPSGTVDELREQQTTLAGQLEEVVKQIGIQEGKGSARKSLAQELARCLEMKSRQEEHFKLVTEADVTEDAATALALEQEAEDLAETVEKIDDPTPVLQEAMAAARANAEEAGVLYAKSQSLLASAEGVVKQAESELAAAESSDWMRVLKLVDYLQKMETCAPSQSGAIQAIRELASKNANPQRVEELRKKIEEVRSKVGACAVTVHQQREHLESAKQDMLSAENAFRQELTSQHERRQANEKALERVRSLQQQATSIRESLTRRDEEIERTMTTIAESEARRIELEGKLNALDAEGGQVPLPRLQQDEVAIRARKEAVERDIEALIRFANLNAELNRAIAKAEQQRVAHEVAKAGLQAVKNVREQIMSKLLQPLLFRMNDFLQACGLRERAYSRLENHKGTPIFDLGWTDGSQEISMDVLSGGEAVIFYASLAFAMTILADPPLKVMLIESAELDSGGAEQLIRGLTHAGAYIGNIIVASCHKSMLQAAVELVEWGIVLTHKEAITA